MHVSLSESANGAFNPNAEQALRSNRTIVPQRVIAALASGKRLRMSTAFVIEREKECGRTHSHTANLFPEITAFESEIRSFLKQFEFTAIGIMPDPTGVYEQKVTGRSSSTTRKINGRENV